MRYSPLRLAKSNSKKKSAVPNSLSNAGGPHTNAPMREVAFDQARQLLKQRLLVGDRNIIRHAGELTLFYRLNAIDLGRIIFIFKQRKHRADFSRIGRVQAATPKRKRT